MTEKTVFTNGCFDIIHVGHVELLSFCKTFGAVIVGINSDESVRRLKGQSRPINSLEDRIKILNSIKYVDSVIPFDEDTPLNLILKLKPDIVVKGGDYKEHEVVGFGLAEIRIFPFIPSFSSTNLIKRLSEPSQDQSAAL